MFHAVVCWCVCVCVCVCVCLLESRAGKERWQLLRHWGGPMHHFCHYHASHMAHGPLPLLLRGKNKTQCCHIVSVYASAGKDMQSSKYNCACYSFNIAICLLCYILHRLGSQCLYSWQKIARVQWNWDVLLSIAFTNDMNSIMLRGILMIVHSVFQ